MQTSFPDARPRGRRRSLLIGVTIAMAMTLGFTAGAAGVSPGPPAHPDKPRTGTSARLDYAALTDVSCPNRTSYCMAVGRFTAHDGTLRSLAYGNHGNGWRVISRGAGITDVHGFASVSCAASRFCAAIADASTGRFAKAAVLHWTGHRWQDMPVQYPYRADLQDVSCSTPTDCVMVGALADTPDDAHRNVFARPASWRWDGERWRAHRRGLRAGQGLSGVSCPAAELCYAVGGTVRNRALVVAWNGVTWTTVHLATDKTRGTRLADISCTYADSCAAVGYRYRDTNRDGAPLVLDLADHRWTVSNARLGKVAHSDRDGAAAEKIDCTNRWCTALLSYTNGRGFFRSAIMTRGPAGGFSLGRVGLHDLAGLSCRETACAVVGSTYSYIDSHVGVGRRLPIFARAFRDLGKSLRPLTVPQP